MERVAQQTCWELGQERNLFGSHPREVAPDSPQEPDFPAICCCAAEDSAHDLDGQPEEAWRAVVMCVGWRSGGHQVFFFCCWWCPMHKRLLVVDVVFLLLHRCTTTPRRLWLPWWLCVVNGELRKQDFCENTRLTSKNNVGGGNPGDHI